MLSILTYGDKIAIGVAGGLLSLLWLTNYFFEWGLNKPKVWIPLGIIVGLSMTFFARQIDSKKSSTQ
jgi:hypothetical protein